MHDTTSIRSACVHQPTDEQQLIKSMCNRSKDQLELVNTAFEEKYELSLRRQIESECTGDFKAFLVSVVTDTAAIDAEWLFSAMSGADCVASTLSDIIVICSNVELSAVKQAYENKFDIPLVDAVGSAAHGSFNAFLQACLVGRRNEGTTCDSRQAAEQAHRLHTVDSKDAEEVFIDVLSTASIVQVDQIQLIYERKHGMSLRRRIAVATKGDLQYALTLRLENRADASCTLLANAMRGSETDTAVIARVLGGVPKTTARGLQERYDDKYGTSMLVR